MSKHFITQKDIEDINKIINASKGLDKLYNKLYELEINNQKETDEYRKYMDYLNISLEIEEKCYKNANLTPQKSSVFAKYLCQYKLTSDYITDSESLINQNYENRYLRRILFKLQNEIFKSNEELYTLLPSDTASFTKSFNDKIDPKYLRNCVTVLNELDNDLLGSYLFFLQEIINSEEYKNLENNFMSSKYNFCFIYPYMEKKLIADNFNINNELYINSKIMANLYNIDIKFYNMLKNEYSELKINDYIRKLLSINDLDYNNKEKSSTAIILTCYIRACLLLMSDEKITDVNFDFHELIENNEYQLKHPNDKISENLIINCFKGIKKDKTKAKTLSLKIK